jgi:hypothetical protein
MASCQGNLAGCPGATNERFSDIKHEEAFAMDAQLAWDSKECRSEKSKKSDIQKLQNFEEQAWLLGQPPLSTYLDYVEEAAAGGVDIPRSELIDEWRTANDYYGELEVSESGFADEVEIFDLDPALQPLADEVQADIRFRRSFDGLPTRFAMVELDRLLVGHPYVTITHTDRLKSRIDTSASPEDLFRFCLPLDRDEAPVHVRKKGSQSYQFWSGSTDFRLQETTLLGPAQLGDLECFGTTSNVLGVMIGYGSNFLNVIESENRLLLHNGHHRAYALRALGFTHVPCIVQTVTRMDELRIAAARAVRDDPAFYFRSKRPPLLKDFFDPQICKVLRVHKEVKVVEVKFEVNEFHVKDFACEV